MRGKESRSRALGFAAAGAIVLALAGCGNHDGSLAGYAPEGQAGKAFAISDVLLDDLTPTTTRFTLYANNTGLETEAYSLSASTDPTFTSLTLPPGWTVVFLDSAFTPVTETADVADSAHAVVYADVTIPIVHPAGPVSLYFRAVSTNAATDFLHVSINVDVAYGRASIERRTSSPAGGGLHAVDLTAGSPLPGGAGAGTGPELAPVVTNNVGLGPQSLASAIAFDSSGANGMRFYFDPANQGYRPGTDYITRPSTSYSTGWSAYVGTIEGFDSFAGTWIRGRGARDGIESSAAVITRPTYVPSATPIELATRFEVPIISPRAPEATPDAFPTVFPPVGLEWQDIPGAASYLVQVVGRTGLVSLSYTGGAEGDPGVAVLEDQELLPGQVFFWDVAALDSQHRVIGFSFDRGSFLLILPVDITNNVPRPEAPDEAAAPGQDTGPEFSPVITNATNPGTTTRFFLVINNTSSAEDGFDLAASADSSFATLAMPPGWGAAFRNEGGFVITRTEEIESDDFQLVYADIFVPASAPAGTASLYFRARSITTGGSDRIHDAVTVNAVPGPALALARANGATPTSAWSRILAERAPSVVLRRHPVGTVAQGGRTLTARREHSLAARLGIARDAAEKANAGADSSASARSRTGKLQPRR